MNQQHPDNPQHDFTILDLDNLDQDLLEGSGQNFKTYIYKINTDGSKITPFLKTYDYIPEINDLQTDLGAGAYSVMIKKQVKRDDGRNSWVMAKSGRCDIADLPGSRIKEYDDPQDDENMDPLLELIGDQIGSINAKMEKQDQIISKLAEIIQDLKGEDPILKTNNGDAEMNVLQKMKIMKEIMSNGTSPAKDILDAIKLGNDMATTNIDQGNGGENVDNPIVEIATGILDHITDSKEKNGAVNITEWLSNPEVMDWIKSETGQTILKTLLKPDK